MMMMPMMMTMDHPEVLEVAPDAVVFPAEEEAVATIKPKLHRK